MISGRLPKSRMSGVGSTPDMPAAAMPEKMVTPVMVTPVTAA